MKTSVITYNKNDGYKEKERFLIHMLTLLDTFDEVNYVDWNSPKRSFLYEIINDLPKLGKIKHFIITPEVHEYLVKDLPNPPGILNNLPINIALRRTDADWFASTTLDNIPPLRHELVEFLSKSDGNTFYTFSRRDIDYKEVLENINNLEVYRNHLKIITEPRYFPAKVTPNDDYSIINCCGDFQIAPTKIWRDIKGVEEEMLYNCFLDTNLQKKVVLGGYKLEAIFDIPMYHMSHKNQLPQGGSIENLHEIAKTKAPPTYNDVWYWVEEFKKSHNEESWGLGDTEIEFEII